MDTLVDIVLSVFEFFGILVDGFITLLQMLYEGLRVLFYCITILPTPLLVGTSALVCICIIYKLLGRESRD